MKAVLGKNPIKQFGIWQNKSRREREELFNDWLLNDKIQEPWRLRVLSWSSFIFWFTGIFGVLVGLQVFFNYPERRNWQFVLFITGAVLWCVVNFGAWLMTRRGNSRIALNLILIMFFAGPIGFFAVGIQDYSRFFNSGTLLATIIFISLLSIRRPQQFQITLSIGAWFALVSLQFILYRNSMTVPVPELLATLAPHAVVTTIAFYLILILQFHRLSVSSKILLSVLMLVDILYFAILGYSGHLLATYLPQTQVENYLRELQFILDFMIGGVALAILLITRLISRPLTQLMDTTRRVQEGDLTVSAPISSVDEIGELSKVFNQMIARLSEILEGLEETVAARTRDLEIAIGVSKQITQVMRLDELLPKLVEDTRAGFDLYFASVYLYDPARQQLLLSAGTGHAGQRMKTERKVFDIEARPSIVAQAARERQAIVIGDIALSKTYFPNPYLPDTRSEAAIPMIVQEDLVGVLGVQAKQLNDFRKEDIRILTSLAEQIGVAVKNARLYEEQLLVADELKRLDRMKTQFLSSMSHELRTPLNAIINFVEMVARGLIGPINPEQEALLNQALTSSQHLLQLINDVLDISKIQAGRLTLFREDRVDLQAEVDAVLNIITGLAQEKGLQLIRDIDPHLPAISCDRRRVRQVLLNLLSNAIKFTEQGTVSLSVKKFGQDVLFAVIDTGPGIPPAKQGVIFEAFMQAEERPNEMQGTGLGLPISRSLVQAHGGSLWLDSEVGKGAAFFFTLPVKIGAK